MRLLAGIWCIAAITAIAPAGLLSAQDWGPPSVDYSATLVFTDERGDRLSHRFYYTSDRQRLDYKVQGEDEITIVDQRAAAVFVIRPALKRYRREPLVTPSYDFGVTGADAERIRIGDESVGGIAAVKYGVATKTGDEFKGFAWITAERVVVRLEGEVKRGRRWRRFTMAVEDLRIGPIDPAVFALPAGYTPTEPSRAK